MLPHLIYFSSLSQGRPFFFTFFTSSEVKLHVTQTVKVEDFIQKHVGELVLPPARYVNYLCACTLFWVTFRKASNFPVLLRWCVPAPIVFLFFVFVFLCSLKTFFYVFCNCSLERYNEIGPYSSQDFEVRPNHFSFFYFSDWCEGI